jgi:hypothetical protein
LGIGLNANQGIGKFRTEQVIYEYKVSPILENKMKIDWNQEFKESTRLLTESACTGKSFQMKQYLDHLVWLWV